MTARPTHRLLALLALLSSLAWALPAFADTYPGTIAITPGSPASDTSFVVEASVPLPGTPMSLIDYRVIVDQEFVDVVAWVQHGTNSATATFTVRVDAPPLGAGPHVLRFFTIDRYGTADFGAPIQRAELAFDVTESDSPVAVEYYNAALGHYFQTTDKNEMAALDNGVIRGWVRTGQAYSVWSAPSFDLVPVCRYYGRPEAGLDTHFFSAFADECAMVGERWPTSWILETPAAYYVRLPSPMGQCPGDTVPVYRLYNNRPSPNHRYTTSVADRSDMMFTGWLSEGYGPMGVAMCAPKSVP